MKRRAVGLLDIKQALFDSRFRKLFPEYKDEFAEFDKNPSCTCNVPLYKKLLEKKEALQSYWPDRDIVSSQEEMDKLSENHWTVINCHIDELEFKLRKLPKGRKQLAIARYDDQVTVVVNELDLL